MNGYVIDKLQHMLPLYTQVNNNNNNLNKIHKLIMRAVKVKQIIIVVDFRNKIIKYMQIFKDKIIKYK